MNVSKLQSIRTASVAALLAGAAHGATMILPGTFTFVDDLGNTSPTTGNLAEPRKNDGTDTFVATGNTFDVVARSRGNTGQNTQQIVTIVGFDVSGLSSTEVNDANFMATLNLNYTGHLNDVQPSINARVGQVASDAAADFDLGFDDGDQLSTAGIAALNSVELISNVSASSNGLSTGQFIPRSVDITPIVVDWFNNPANNHGLVFFLDNTNASQAAYFEDLSIVTEVVPEPTSLGLFALGAMAFGMRRRRA